MARQADNGQGHGLGFTLSVLTGLQILASLGLQWYLLARLGAGAETDAFYAGSTLTQVIAVVAIDTLAVVLVPLWSSVTDERLRTDGWLLCAVAMAGFTTIAAALAVAAPLLTSLLVPGFSAEGKSLTVTVTRIHVLGLGGAACTVILSSIHQVRGRFLWPPIAALSSALAAWALVVWRLESDGIAIGAWAQVLAFSGPAVLMAPALGWPPRTGWRFDVLPEVARRLRPLVAARAYFLTSAPLDRLLVSFLPTGSLVMFEIVSRLFSAVQRVLMQGVLTPILPRLARLAQAREWRDFKTLCGQQTIHILVLSLLVVAMLELVALTSLSWLAHSGRPLIGRITADDLRQIAWLAALMSGSLPCTVIINALSNAYYAQGDTRTPSQIAAAAFTVGMVLKAGGFWIRRHRRSRVRGDGVGGMPRIVARAGLDQTHFQARA